MNKLALTNATKLYSSSFRDHASGERGLNTLSFHIQVFKIQCGDGIRKRKNYPAADTKCQRAKMAAGAFKVLGLVRREHSQNNIQLPDRPFPTYQVLKSRQSTE